jgi:cell division septum initiation protein DivIVA
VCTLYLAFARDGSVGTRRNRETSCIAEPGHGLYDLGVSEDWAASQRNSESNGLLDRIDDLEVELERYRSQEQLLVKTLLSATNHAAAIRESARREAELTLRKARIEAERLKAGAERERDDASHELVRLRRITEQMRNGLSAFLTAKVEELQVETGEEAMPSRQENELEAALGSALEGRSATELRSGAESASPTAGGSEPRRT